MFLVNNYFKVPSDLKALMSIHILSPFFNSDTDLAMPYSVKKA